MRHIRYLQTCNSLWSKIASKFEDTIKLVNLRLIIKWKNTRFFRRKSSKNGTVYAEIFQQQREGAFPTFRDNEGTVWYSEWSS